MRSKFPDQARGAVAVSAAALMTAAALVMALAPETPAAPLPLPLPVAGAEPLVTEGITVEGPLINNLGLPTQK
ncbi:hypothetical protein [Streptomyces sp. NPDC052701]|uniref:hypothetical protein n=1 Tax=Streptomyces sp. NPDC052701 TaxID=3155533 RepID=UPI00343356C8